MQDETESTSRSDRDLGMDRPILRRNFLNGVGAGLAGAMLVPNIALAQERTSTAGNSAGYYPPEQTDMRGSHAGSFEIAHSLRDQRQWDLTGAVKTGEHYDLVVVGGGLSGLGAAHYFQKFMGKTATVLILDNHDDFGGHAKRK